MRTSVAFHLSALADRIELVLVSFNGKDQRTFVHFPRHNSPNSRALAELAGEVSGSDS